MQRMTFYKNLTRTTLNCIIEPLKETDEVYVVSDGKVYKWDNTATETTTEYLEHFKEVKNIDCSVFNNNSCSDSNASFIDIVEKEATKWKVKYESNNKNPVKTEYHLLNHCVKNCDVFPNNWEKVTIKDDICSIAEWIINVNKSVAIDLIPDEYKALQDNEALKHVLMGSLIVTLNDDSVNKLIAIAKAVKDYCDKLKAAKEAKKPADNKEEKKSDEAA